MICQQYALVPQKSFCWKLVDVVQNVGCFLSLFWMLYLTSLVNQSLCLAKNVFYKNRIQIQIAVANMLFILSTWRPKGKLGSVAEGSAVLIRPCQGGGGGGSHVPCLNFKTSCVGVINACRLLSALASLLQLGRGRLSLVAISFYALSLLFGPCHLLEFTLAGPLIYFRVAHWVLFIVLSIFCIMSVGDWTHPQNQETTHEFTKRYVNYSQWTKQNSL